MTKEQEIYKNMKRNLYKSHGKWTIGIAKLYKAIWDAGYNKAQSEIIIKGMETKGYIRRTKNVNGKPTCGHYVIEKWVN